MGPGGGEGETLSLSLSLFVYVFSSLSTYIAVLNQTIERPPLLS